MDTTATITITLPTVDATALHDRPQFDRTPKVTLLAAHATAAGLIAGRVEILGVPFDFHPVNDTDLIVYMIGRPGDRNNVAPVTRYDYAYTLGNRDVYSELLGDHVLDVIDAANKAFGDIFQSAVAATAGRVISTING